nr:ComF family protein [Neobacillus sp. Marseille-Q6967]
MSLFPLDYCLICHEIIRPNISWRSIFSTENQVFVCPDCEKKFEKIGPNRCKTCCRDLQLLDEKFQQNEICNDCIRWEEDQEWAGYLEKNTSIFLYNDFFKEVLAKFKFRGDYLLVKYFANNLKETLQKINSDCIVPIPLSNERLYERGFNQAEALILEAGYKPVSLLTRLHAEKQSKKSRTERIHISQVFQLDSHQDVEGKSILIVDDIYTTGSTLRHAAKLLKEAGAEKIQSLTLAR